MTTLYTQGYEQKSLDDFIAPLLEHQVGLVVDVRQLPLSRKKGFSKTAFCEGLNKAGIGYLHVKALGNPKYIREAAKAEGATKALAMFRNHMEAQGWAALAPIEAMLNHESMCLVCYERDPGMCHRSVVADAVATKHPSITIKHL